MVLGLLDQSQIARAFKRSRATRAVALHISKAFDRVSYVGLLHKLKCYGISGHIFGLIFSFPSNRRPRVVLNGKFAQEYPVNSKIPQSSIHFSYYTRMTFVMMLSVILLSMPMILISTLNVIRHLICGNN